MTLANHGLMVRILQPACSSLPVAPRALAIKSENIEKERKVSVQQWFTSFCFLGLPNGCLIGRGHVCPNVDMPLMSSPTPRFQSSCCHAPLISSPCSIHFWHHPQHVTGRKEVARLFIDKENLTDKQDSGRNWRLFCLFLANSLPSQQKRMNSEFSSGLGKSFWSAGLNSQRLCAWLSLKLPLPETLTKNAAAHTKASQLKRPVCNKLFWK